MIDPNVLTVQVAENETGEWGVYFTLVNGDQETFFTKVELEAMLAQMDS